MPLGDEVQTHTHHTHDHTPNTTPHHQPRTRSQHQRSLRSRDARQRRAQQRIHNRATHRRNYRNWRSALTPTPYTVLSQGTDSLGQSHQQKPLYDLTGRTPSHRRLQQQRRRQKQQYTTTLPLPATANNTHRCHRFRRFLQNLFKMKRKPPQNRNTPSHLRTDTRPAPQNRQQWQDRRDTKQRQHTRAHWFKTHIAQPSKKGRTKHDVQTTTQHHLRGAFWNTTGLLEAAKLHTLIDIMRKHRLSSLALTETHIKQPDQFMIDGYTITHSARPTHANIHGRLPDHSPTISQISHA